MPRSTGTWAQPVTGYSRFPVGNATRAPRQWLAEQILASVEQNAGRLQRKTDQATWLFRLVLFEAVAAGVGVTTTALLTAAP